MHVMSQIKGLLTLISPWSDAMDASVHASWNSLQEKILVIVNYICVSLTSDNFTSIVYHIEGKILADKISPQ